jgi:hypothetical protein
VTPPPLSPCTFFQVLTVPLWNRSSSHRYTLIGPMSVVLVVAADWTMRTPIRAELRERGIDALGIDSADDAVRTLAPGKLPDAIVLEATAELLGDPRIQDLVHRVPSVLIASRTVIVPLPEATVVLYRPIRIAEIVECVSQLIARDHTS